jgi:aspartate aminotransferase-like enzyme
MSAATPATLRLAQFAADTPAARIPDAVLHQGKRCVINVGDLNKELGKRGKEIANGYGDLKEKTFRIAHMGDMTNADLEELLRDIDQIVGL